MTTFGERTLEHMRRSFRAAPSFRCNLVMLVEESDGRVKLVPDEFPNKSVIKIGEITYDRILQDEEFQSFLYYTCIRNSDSRGTNDKILDYYVRIDRDLNSKREKDILLKVALGRCKNVRNGEERVLAALKALKEMSEEDIEQVRMMISAGAI